MVEDVEKHVLRFFLAAEELHIINDEYIHHLIEVTEVIDSVVADRIDELVGETF